MPVLTDYSMCNYLQSCRHVLLFPVFLEAHHTNQYSMTPDWCKDTKDTQSARHQQYSVKSSSKGTHVILMASAILHTARQGPYQIKAPFTSALRADADRARNSNSLGWNMPLLKSVDTRIHLFSVTGWRKPTHLKDGIAGAPP